jgi:glutathione S-transferase
MTLTLHGHPGSSNSQKVTWCLAELGLDYAIALLGGPYPGRREPEYLALNPNGQVPTLVDGDFVLWESNSICRYLSEIHGGGRMTPVDSQARAIANHWMDWQLAAVNGPVTALVVEIFRTGEPDRDAARIRAAAESSAEMWSRMEAQFGAGPYVAGDFSIGDIPVGIYYHRFKCGLEAAAPALASAEIAALPRLDSWYADLKARAPFVEHVLSQPMPVPR